MIMDAYQVEDAECFQTVDVEEEVVVIENQLMQVEDKLHYENQLKEFAHDECSASNINEETAVNSFHQPPTSSGMTHAPLADFETMLEIINLQQEREELEQAKHALIQKSRSRRPYLRTRHDSNQIPANT